MIYSVFAEVIAEADPALCSVAEADRAMRQFAAWDIKDNDEKETEIKAASAVISDLDSFYGEKIEADQPFEFPRTIEGVQEVFGLAPQRKKVLSAMVVLMTYRLGQVPVGVDSASLGDESVSHRGAQIPHEVRGHLWPYIRK